MLLGPVGVRTRDPMQQHHRIPVPINPIPSTQPPNKNLAHHCLLTDPTTTIPTRPESRSRRPTPSGLSPATSSTTAPTHPTPAHTGRGISGHTTQRSAPPTSSTPALTTPTAPETNSHPRNPNDSALAAGLVHRKEPPFPWNRNHPRPATRRPFLHTLRFPRRGTPGEPHPKPACDTEALHCTT
jgi:hypothetical protein